MKFGWTMAKAGLTGQDNEQLDASQSSEYGQVRAELLGTPAEGELHIPSVAIRRIEAISKAATSKQTREAKILTGT